MLCSFKNLKIYLLLDLIHVNILIYHLDPITDCIYIQLRNLNMSKKCELTGKSPLKGHKVSHANNKIKRKFFPNLKHVTFRSDILKRNVKLNVSNAALRSVDYKGGLDFYLKSVKSFKLSLKAKKLKNKIIAKA